MSRVGVSAKAARTEALRLYRDVLRACRVFDTTRNEQGQLMSDVLRTSARKEFEAAREERDPETVARMIITGRDCVMQIHDMVAKKQHELMTGEKEPPATQ